MIGLKDGAAVIFLPGEEKDPAAVVDSWIAEAEYPDNMLLPRLVGGVWRDEATLDDKKRQIDSETVQLIRAWAHAQGKNEAYYLNCGILGGREDPEFAKYAAARAEILERQKRRKVELESA